MSNLQDENQVPRGAGHPKTSGASSPSPSDEPHMPDPREPSDAPYASWGPAYGASAPPPQYPPPPTSDPRGGLPTWVVVLIVVLVLALIVAVGVALTSSLGADRDESTGEVVAGGDLSAFDLRVGDCLIDPFFRDSADGQEGETFDSVPAVPCEQPHDVEVYAIVSLDEGAWPGESAVGEQADDVCYDRFEPYVGRSYETSVLEFGSYLPTEDSWSSGDRGVTCLVLDPSGQVRGSLKSAAR